MDSDDVEGSGNRSPTFLPQEAMYADDADFLTISEQEKNTITEKIGEILLRPRSHENGTEWNGTERNDVELFQKTKKFLQVFTRERLETFRTVPKSGRL